MPLRFTGAAEEKKAVAKVLEDIRQLVVILREDGSIVKYLANPVWNLDSKREALSEVARKLKLDKETLNCLDIVAAKAAASANCCRYWKSFSMSGIVKTATSKSVCRVLKP